MTKIFERQGHYTQIDNLVIDELMQTLSGLQFKVLMVIIRKTIGWGKEEDNISLSQIRQTAGTTNKNSVIEAIRHLEAQGLIIVSRPGGVATNSFSLNKGYDFSGNKSVTTDSLGSNKSVTASSNKTVTAGSNKSVTHKRKTLKKVEESAAAQNSEQIQHKELALKIAVVMGIDHLPVKAQVSDLNTITEWLVSVEATPADVELFGRYWWGDKPPSIFQVKKFWSNALAQKAVNTSPPKLTPAQAQVKYDMEFAL